MSTAGGVRARAPAKVNLELVVGAPGADGYHPLATVFHAVSLYDEVIADVADGLAVTVEGDQAHLVPDGPENLAYAAARLLASRAGVPAKAHLQIRKSIPVAGGMGGGSADAAAALVACDALWHTHLSREDLAELAAELGSDVPFALFGGTAVGTGRGHRLTSALARGELHWVLALAEVGLSTPQVYAECDRLRGSRPQPEPDTSPALMQALSSGDPVAVARRLRNDLQPAACSLRPRLRTTLEVGEEYGALGGIVSGSGPTVAFLVRDNEHALDLSVALTASGAVHAVRRVLGPAHGARVVEPVRVS